MTCYYHEDHEASIVCKVCKKLLCADCVNGEDGCCWSCSHDVAAGIHQSKEKDVIARRKVREYAICFVTFLGCYGVIFTPFLFAPISIFLIILVALSIAWFINLPASLLIEWFLEASITSRGFYRYAAGLIIYLLAGAMIGGGLLGFTPLLTLMAISLTLSLFFNLRMLRASTNRMKWISRCCYAAAILTMIVSTIVMVK